MPKFNSGTIIVYLLTILIIVTIVLMALTKITTGCLYKMATTSMYERPGGWYIPDNTTTISIETILDLP